MTQKVEFAKEQDLSMKAPESKRGNGNVSLSANRGES